MKEIKINMVTTWKRRCGISTYSEFLINELKKYVKIRVIPIKNSLNPLYWFKVARSSRKGCDIVHVQFEYGIFGHLWKFVGIFSPLFYFILSLPKNPPVITTMHEVREEKFRRFLNVFISKYSDIIIVHTKHSKKILQAKRKKSITLIPHGSYQNPIFLSKEKCKQKLGLKGKTVLTIFGYVNKYKGYETILEILPMLDKDIILLIAGGPRLRRNKTYFESLKQKVNNNDQVKMIGFVKDGDLPLVLNASDIMLFPYIHVTQSGTLHIAIAYRKPIITSDLPAFREIKQKYNCLEIARNSREFLEKIELLLSDKKRRRYLIKNTKRYWNKTNWATTAKRTVKEYFRII